MQGTTGIKGSGGVDSVTDEGLGSFTVNLAVTMPDTNYAVSLGGAGQSTSPNYGTRIYNLYGTQAAGSSQTTSSFRINCQDYAGTAYDSGSVFASVFR